MAGSFDFLHIKRRTAGSSNELSFDVLDLKSAEADGKGPRAAKAKAGKGPKASQGTYHGVAGTSTLSGQAEVEKRKKARQSHRLRLQVVGVVVVVALVAAGVYAGMRIHESRTDIAGQVDALIGRLSAVDETLVEVDAMMGDPFDDELAERRAAVVAMMPQLTKELNRISVDAQTLTSLPLDERTEIVVGQLTKTSQSRIGMLTIAGDAFSLSSEAAGQVSRANSVWNDVMRADQLAREAIAAANRATTQEATSQAIESTREAIDGFEDALFELRNLSATYGVDFAGQEAYLTKKIEALENEVATCEALIAGNRDAATAANEAYGAADAEAARLAEALPPSIGDIVQARFARDMDAFQERYQEIRDSTVSADSVIRDYLQ